MANKSTGIYGHFGNYASAAQLPNVLGATVQTGELSVGALATVGGTVYVCTTATAGAGVWAAVGGAAGATSGEWAANPVDTGGFATVGQPSTGYWTRSGNVVYCSAYISYAWAVDGQPQVNLDVPNDGTSDLTIAGLLTFTPAVTTLISILGERLDASTFNLNFITSLVTGNTGVVTASFMYETDAP